MKLNELDEFNLNDAVTFHDELNPALFTGSSLKPEVRSQLLTIAEDFLEHLGITDLDVEDITISGSNAGYSYTAHSDIDLHVIVDMSKLRDDIVYRELFDAKKNLYNTTHDIEINGYEVELYVQDSNDPVISLGEYSVSKNKWIHLPRKRRAHFDQVATAAKFNKLMSVAEIANKSKNLDLVKKVIDTIKRYRQAGLDAHGEFGPENLAFKAIRSRGLINHLRKLVQVLHSEKLSLPESTQRKQPTKKYGVSLFDSLKRMHKDDKHLRLADEDFDPNGKPPGPEFKPTMPKGTVRVDVSDVYDWYKLGKNISDLDNADPNMFGKGPPSTIMAFGSEDEEHKYINDLEKLGLTTTDIDPVDPKQPKGMKRQKVDPTYNVSEASGYIPSEKEKNDPRFKTALTVDIKPDSIKKNAKAFGFKTSRAGIPPLLR